MYFIFIQYSIVYLLEYYCSPLFNSTCCWNSLSILLCLTYQSFLSFSLLPSVLQRPCGAATSPCVSAVRRWRDGRGGRGTKESFSAVVSRRPGHWWRGWPRRTTLYRAWWTDRPRPLATAVAQARLKNCRAAQRGTDLWKLHRLDRWDSHISYFILCVWVGLQLSCACWKQSAAIHPSVPLGVYFARAACVFEAWDLLMNWYHYSSNDNNLY